jgi:cephalosporin hydroxylase
MAGIAETSAELAHLAELHNTDKGHASITRSTLRGRHTLTGKGYTDTYGRFFGDLRGEPIALLEIGVDRGASIPVWEDFFTRASLAAIDIKEKCRKFETSRTRVHIGSQTDPEFLRQVSSESGPFDVVIDDGGHTMEQHFVSLTTLWPLLNAAGMYVIEDLHTAYRPEFGGAYLSPDSTVERFKHLIDGLQSDQAGPQVVSGLAGMWFARSICVLLKA